MYQFIQIIWWWVQYFKKCLNHTGNNLCSSYIYKVDCQRLTRGGVLTVRSLVIACEHTHTHIKCHIIAIALMGTA